jgi:hypothetical protein
MGYCPLLRCDTGFLHKIGMRCPEVGKPIERGLTRHVLPMMSRGGIAVRNADNWQTWVDTQKASAPLELHRSEAELTQSDLATLRRLIMLFVDDHRPHIIRDLLHQIQETCHLVTSTESVAPIRTGLERLERLSQTNYATAFCRLEDKAASRLVDAVYSLPPLESSERLVVERVFTEAVDAYHKHPDVWA